MISRVFAGVIPLCVLLLTACHRHNPEPSALQSLVDSTASTQPFLPAIGFLREQVSELDSFPSPLVLRSDHNGRRDSTAIRPAMAGAMASFFLLGEVSEPYYNQTTFPDSSDNCIVVSYTAKADTTPLNTVDVYVDPQTHGIKRLYLMYQQDFGDSSVRRQLIWYTGHEFTLITSVDKGGYTSDRRTDKVTWSPP